MPFIEWLTKLLAKMQSNEMTIPCHAITTFFNRLLQEGAVPITWECSILVPVSKPGQDSAIPSNLRGISATISEEAIHLMYSY